MKIEKNIRTNQLLHIPIGGSASLCVCVCKRAENKREISFLFLLVYCCEQSGLVHVGDRQTG